MKAETNLIMLEHKIIFKMILMKWGNSLKGKMQFNMLSTYEYSINQ